MSELSILHDCATVQLTQGQNTLIDARFYPRLSAFRWHAHAAKYGGPFYAGRNISKGQGRGGILRLHHVVLDDVAGPRPPGCETRHLNGDSLDNRAENLRYGTHAENMRDAVAHGTHHRGFRIAPPRGELNHKAKLGPRDIPKIRRAYEAGETQASIAARYGVCEATIQHVISGRNWKHIR